jgi:GTP-sensing pleiotropic transcriptional regulator CodY
MNSTADILKLINQNLRPVLVTKPQNGLQLATVEREQTGQEISRPAKRLAYKYANTHDLGNYLQIVESIYAASQRHGIQVVGFTSASKQQETSTLAAVISTLISLQMNDSANLAATPMNGNLKSTAEFILTQKTLRITESIKHYASLKKSHHDAGKNADPSQKSVAMRTSITRFTSYQNEYDETFNDYDFSEKSFCFNETFDRDRASLNDGCKALQKTQAAEKRGVFLIDEHWDVMAPHLEKLKAKKRFILIDIPPVLHHSKSIQIAQHCDAVVMVIRAKQVRREVINEAKRKLESAGVEILGGVLVGRKYYIPNWLYRKL